MPHLFFTSILPSLGNEHLHLFESATQTAQDAVPDSQHQQGHRKQLLPSWVISAAQHSQTPEQQLVVSCTAPTHARCMTTVPAVHARGDWLFANDMQYCCTQSCSTFHACTLRCLRTATQTQMGHSRYWAHQHLFAAPLLHSGKGTPRMAWVTSQAFHVMLQPSHLSSWALGSICCW